MSASSSAVRGSRVEQLNDVAGGSGADLSQNVSGGVINSEHAKLSAERLAVLNQLDDCIDCNNKAKRECVFKRCKTCCNKLCEVTGRSCEAHPLDENPNANSLVGKKVIGVIDGSFENGYFLTCTVDDMTYKGVIFTSMCAVKVFKLPKSSLAAAGHVGTLEQLVQRKKRKYVKSGLFSKKRQALGNLTSSAPSGSLSNSLAVGPSSSIGLPDSKLGNEHNEGDDMDDNDDDSAQHHTRKQTNKSRGVPKRPKTAYLCYLTSMRHSVQKEYPTKSFAEITQTIADRWKSLTPDQRRPFAEEAEKDKQRYARERNTFHKAGGTGMLMDLDAD